MKYLLLLLALISAMCIAQDMTVKRMYVFCNGSKTPKILANSEQVDKEVRSDECRGSKGAWADTNYYYPPVSSKPSSSSVQSSVPSVPVVVSDCPKFRENGDPLSFNEISGYDLNCDGRHEKFTQKQCAISYATSLPLLTKSCSLAAFDTNGVYSKYEVVSQ